MTDPLAEALAERDRARSTAVALEAELTETQTQLEASRACHEATLAELDRVRAEAADGLIAAVGCALSYRREVQALEGAARAAGLRIVAR